MQILSENRLYNSSELEREIHIADNASVIIFDKADMLEKVTFGNASKLKYFGYFSDEARYVKDFDISGGDARCEVYALLSSQGQKISAKLNGMLTSSGSFLDMNIVSFVSDAGVIDLDGIVDIVKNVEKVEGYLSEENIFLGSSGKVRGLPTLLVHSDDVKASHGCNMERIPDEKLYYLRSRGLPKEDATVMMLESYIYKIFGGLEEVDADLYLDIKEQILEALK